MMIMRGKLFIIRYNYNSNNFLWSLKLNSLVSVVFFACLWCLLFYLELHCLSSYSGSFFIISDRRNGV